MDRQADRQAGGQAGRQAVKFNKKRFSWSFFSLSLSPFFLKIPLLSGFYNSTRTALLKEFDEKCIVTYFFFSSFHRILMIWKEIHNFKDNIYLGDQFPDAMLFGAIASSWA